MTGQTSEETARKAWLAVLARTSAEEIEARLAEVPPLPGYTRLRGPEIGLVMVRGRAGGDSAPFNLGEMTVTRCSVVLADGRIGHALRTGRDRRAAELSAVLDAALQDAALRPALHAAVIAPLAAAQQARRQAEAERAAATRVEFLSMVQIR